MFDRILLALMIAVIGGLVFLIYDVSTERVANTIEAEVVGPYYYRFGGLSKSQVLVKNGNEMFTVAAHPYVAGRLKSGDRVTVETIKTKYFGIYITERIKED